MELLQDLVNAVLTTREHEESLQNQLFSRVHKAIFMDRIEEMCKQTVRGREEPKKSSDRFYIPFCIVADGFKEGEWPTEEVIWNVTNTGKVYVEVVAQFQGEIDNSHTFIFPVAELEWEQFMMRMILNAEDREEMVRDIERKAVLLQQDIDRDIYETLRKQFEPEE